MIRSVRAMVAAALFAVSIACSSLSTDGGPCRALSPMTASPAAPKTEGPVASIGRDEAIGVATRLMQATNVTRTAAKLMTWSEYESTACVGHLATPPADAVWVVAIVGDLADLRLGLPKTSETFRSAVVTVHATKGLPFMWMESPAAAWPAWFDALPDHESAPIPPASPTTTPRP